MSAIVPIILNMTTTISQNKTVNVLDESVLKNPYHAPMLIDEVLVTITGSSASNLYGTVVRAKYNVGRYALSEKYIPVIGYGEMYNLNATANSGCYSWRPKKPIYIPAGQILSPSFQYVTDSGFTEASLNLGVTYIGRSMAANTQPPKFIEVPWLGVYLGPNNVGGANYSQQSQEADLYNPGTAPLFIDRFNGAVIVYNTTNIFISSTNLQPTIGASLVTAQITDQLGRIVARDKIPLTHLFQRTSDIWDTKVTLQGRGYYITFIDSTLATITATTSAQALVVMEGHRKVQLMQGRYL